MQLRVKKNFILKVLLKFLNSLTYKNNFHRPELNQLKKYNIIVFSI